MDNSPAPQEREPLKLWPGRAPGAAGVSDPLDVPTITPFFPSANATGASIVVCPGGGYQALAAHEANPVAHWLNTLGIAAFVLKYRLAPRSIHPNPLSDAQRAIRTVRAGASDWKLDPTRIGILGFSAGGHLAATAATHFDEGNAMSADPIERVSSRPDVSILLYAVISMADGLTHKGTRTNLLGASPSQELIELLSTEKRVTPRTPPAFLFHTVEDAGVPVENSVAYAMALRKAGVAFEMHLYEKGRHGVGLAADDPVLRTWPGLFAAWLGGQGFIRTRDF